MGQTRRVEVTFSAEDKAEVVEDFLASGKAISEVAQEYGLAEPTLRDWVQEAADEVAGREVAGQETDAGSQSWVEPDTSSAEYRAQVVAWYLSSGRTIAEVASSLNLSESTVREWVWTASPEDFAGHAPLPEWVSESLGELDCSGSVPDGVEHEFGEEDAAQPLATTAAEVVAQDDLMAAHAGAAEALARAEQKAAEAAAQAEAAAEAEAAARAETAAARSETAAAYAAAVEAMVRAEVMAAETVARAEAAADEAVARAQAVATEAEAAAADALARSGSALVEAEAARAEAATRISAETGARGEMAAVYAEAVEVMMRAEVSADKEVAQAHAVAAKAQLAAAEAVALSEATVAEAVAQCQAAVTAAEGLARSEVAARVAAEAGARDEIAAAYAAAVEAMVRAEVMAAELVARAEAATAEGVAQAEARVPAAEGLARGQVIRPDAVGSSEELPAAVLTPAGAAASSTGRALDREEAEAEALAKIAEVVARLAPVELWVRATGRSLAEARKDALEQLGVNEDEAEFEVLSHGSRWLPGRVQIRARVCVAGAR